MERKIRLYVMAAVVAVLVVGVLWLMNGVGKDNGRTIVSTPLETSSEDLTATSAATPEPTVAATPDDYYEDEFMTDTEEPLLLWKADDRKLYVEKRQLYYSSEATERQPLYEWESAVPAQVWLNGEYLLVGSQAQQEGEEDAGWQRGEWFILQLKDGTVHRSKREMFFGPQEVLAMTAGTEPRVFFAKVKNGESYSEHLLDPTSDVDWVRLLYYGEGTRPVVNTDLNKEKAMKSFRDSRAYPLSDGRAVYTFVDDIGEITYLQHSDYLVRRRDGIQLTDVKSMPFLEEGTRALGRFRNETGEELMFLLGHNEVNMRMEPKLWEQDWKALNDYTFTRISSVGLEVIQYPEQFDLEVLTPQYKRFPVPEGSLAAEEGPLLTYQLNGEKRYVSWYDLAYTEQATPQMIWLSALPDYAAKEVIYTYEADFMDAKQVPQLTFEENNTNAAIPEELYRAVEELYPTSDYGFAKTYRKIGEIWYVIADKMLNAYRNGKLEVIGELPVTVITSVGEGFGGRGVRDFLTLNDGWIIADTEASRVLKLNGDLEIVAELAIPTPYRLKLQGDELQIATFGKSVYTNLNVEPLREQAQPFASTAKLKKAEHEYFWRDEYYEDAESGLSWYYFDGYLYQYHAKRQQMRTFFFGYMENFQAHVRIIPYGDEVLVLLDRRMERFDRQGNWRQTLLFPRVEPDGIYDRTPRGENSYVLNERNGMLYSLQGFRIVGIDIAQNKVETVFRQSYADMGELMAHNNSLYFMLHSNGNDRYTAMSDQAAREKMHTEIVKLDMENHQVQRYIVDGYYDAMELGAASDKEPAIVLNIYKSPAN
ncbi:hypothetical protein M6D81_08215 [Paenibacillus sp. J5C_2022]|uniref:hypothetical protein n=1 Tax=Paenibacillus sp. J5C2022 TaxID=2977129 RepID=UPI0021D0952B|nr:hypothetical protein [Paenibacillus sp. J5C2022]MCU6708701.1 hypothetical protein [Paenibacillus sp. J5C2022]